MIQSKKDLDEYIAADRKRQLQRGKKWKIISKLLYYPENNIERFLYYLRKQEYYLNTAYGSKVRGFLGLYYERKKNKLGQKLGIEIGPNCFGKGLRIYHSGNIVVNYAARIGDNCKLHGSNCIGNDGKTQAAPRIGNNADIGFGAVIIGDIEIADHAVIGANAVVRQSVYEEGATLVGVPANVVKCKGENKI